MKTKQEKENALKQAKQKEQEYKLLRITRKNFIKQEPNKTKRFFKLLWFYISFPFVWLWRNIKDWRTLITIGVKGLFNKLKYKKIKEN